MGDSADELGLARTQPSGRPLYTTGSPALAETLRKTLTQTHGEDGFDLYIRGSKEHVEAIEAARAHHESQREQLRKTHKDAFAQFEHVRDELDSLAAELDALTSQSVSLDANFDKFGFNAHIRTVEDKENGLSRASSTSGRGERGERVEAEAIPLFKKPSIRQYFHKGLIWRNSESSEVSSIELLVDLIYVGILDVIGETAAADHNGESFLRFCIIFVLSYRLWLDITTCLSWVEIGDLFQRICILIYMTFLIGFTVNIAGAFDSTYAELIAFYVGERLFTALYYCGLSIWIPMMRGPFICFAALMAVGAAFFIGSIHVDYPNQLALIWVGLFLDLFGNGVLLPVSIWSGKLKDSFLAPIVKYFEFYPALNIEHKTERMNAFVTLVLGYLVLAVLYQSNAPAGIDAFFGKAIFGLIIVFSMSLLYFETDSSNLHVHAIRRHAVSFFVWQNLHLLFILGFVLASGAAKIIVIAHDCSEIERLEESFATDSVESLDAGIRWFFCGGMGVALLSTAGIAISHDHRDFQGQRLRKRYRLALRCVAAIVIICLPTADRLNSLDLMAIVACLIAFSLAVELWGCSDSSRGSFWADWSACQYATECKLSKADIAAMRRGELTDVDEILGRQKARDKRKEGTADIA